MRLGNLSRDVFPCLQGLDEDIDNIQTSTLLSSFPVLYLTMKHRILNLPGEEIGRRNMLIYGICMYEQCNQVLILRASAVPMIHLAHISSVSSGHCSPSFKLRSSSFYSRVTLPLLLAAFAGRGSTWECCESSTV